MYESAWKPPAQSTSGLNAEESAERMHTKPVGIVIYAARQYILTLS